jgi:hypothetical protein
MRRKGSGKVGGSMKLMSKGKFATYDSAEHTKGSQKKIIEICEHYDKLTAWEQSFITSRYGQEPLKRRDHIIIGRIYKKAVSQETKK